MTGSCLEPGFIGVFDSGVGGLTVVRRIWERIPSVPIVFVADQAHVPYGGRPLSEVAAFARGISSSLVDAGAGAIVMACNVSTATALAQVKSCYPRTFGVIGPGALAAVERTSAASVGVLATAGTVQTGAYTRAIRAINDGVRITEVACPQFVPLIESGNLNGVETVEAAQLYLSPILKAGADTVILGCTHYPFLIPCLKQLAPNINFIDPAEYAVCDLAAGFEARGTTSSSLYQASHVLYTTGESAAFARQVSFFLPHAEAVISVRQAFWIDGKLHFSVS